MHRSEMQSNIKVTNKTIFKRMIVQLMRLTCTDENEPVREHIFMSMVLQQDLSKHRGKRQLV